MYRSTAVRIINKQSRVALTTIDGVTRVVDTKNISLEENYLTCTSPSLCIDYDNIDKIEGIISKEQELVRNLLKHKKCHNIPITIVGEQFQFKGTIIDYSKTHIVINMQFDYIIVPLAKVTSIY